MHAKSDENWSEGYRCYESNSLNVAASRLYYAVFQAVLFYAREKQHYGRDENHSVHSDMVKLLRREYVGHPYQIKAFLGLLKLRKMADYDPDNPQKTEIQPLLNDANSMRAFFLNAAES